MSTRRFLVTAGTALLLSACAGGPGPNLNGPEGPGIMQAYSGDWVLLRLESDNMAEKIRGAQGAPGGAGSGLPGGMQGGRSSGRGGGMTGGRGGMPGGGRGGMPGGSQVDPEQMRARMETVRTLAEVPEEMTLDLRADQAILTPTDQPGLALTLGADEASFHQGQMEFFARAKWTKDGLVIQKEVDDGFAVEDKLSLDDQGHLVMKRKVHLMGRAVEGRLVYRRGNG